MKNLLHKAAIFTIIITSPAMANEMDTLLFASNGSLKSAESDFISGNELDNIVGGSVQIGRGEISSAAASVVFRALENTSRVSRGHTTIRVKTPAELAEQMALRIF